MEFSQQMNTTYIIYSEFLLLYEKGFSLSKQSQKSRSSKTALDFWNYFGREILWSSYTNDIFKVLMERAKYV